MKKYKIFIDVSHNWKESDIEVIETVSEGNTAEEAYQTLCERIENGDYNKIFAGRCYYIWRTNESDVVED